ncbi:hypothetical protein M728_005237 (plasmid) [Ensifer sp. WSM1721]
MRLNTRTIAASYDTARIFAGFGFGSSTREQVDHLSPAPHQLVLRQHAYVGALLLIDPACQAPRHGRYLGSGPID